MDTLCINLEDKVMNEAIISELKESITEKCKKCGTVMCNSIKLAKELHGWIKKTSRDRGMSAINYKMGIMLDDITVKHSFIVNMTSDELATWCVENNARKCKFIKKSTYVVSNQVCIVSDSKCDCFAEAKKEIHKKL